MSTQRLAQFTLCEIAHAHKLHLPSLDRRNGVETVYFPNFRDGSKINWPKSKDKSDIKH